MANTKSAIKNVRKTERRTLRNKAVKTRLKTLRKKMLATEGEGGETARTAAAEYVAAMDKAAKTKVIHRNAASRAKARASKVLAPASAS
jgi:small subunit ribosomal protein S20